MKNMNSIKNIDKKIYNRCFNYQAKKKYKKSNQFFKLKYILEFNMYVSNKKCFSFMPSVICFIFNNA